MVAQVRRAVVPERETIGRRRKRKTRTPSHLTVHANENHWHHKVELESVIEKVNDLAQRDILSGKKRQAARDAPPKTSSTLLARNTMLHHKIEDVFQFRYHGCLE